MPLPLIGVSTAPPLAGRRLAVDRECQVAREALELHVAELGLELVEAAGLDLLHQVEIGVVLLEGRQQLEGRHLDDDRGLEALFGVDRERALGGVERGPEQVRRERGGKR